MNKKLTGLLALGMSLIMSVSAIAAPSSKGASIVKADIDDGMSIVLEAKEEDNASKKVTEVFAGLTINPNATGVDTDKLALLDYVYDVKVKNTAGEYVEYDKAAEFTAKFPSIPTTGTAAEYYAVIANANDGPQLVKIEDGTAAAAADGAVLADVSVPTISGNEITFKYSTLKNAVVAIYVVNKDAGDFNPVIPVLAVVVVVSAAVLLFGNKKRA